jgi:ribosomal-protein-alanine N-acetyltransferase
VEGFVDERVPTLRTQRLVLRPPEERDIEAWFARATDREAAAMAGDAVPETIAAGAAWLARSREQAALGKRLQWSIGRVGLAGSIGTVSLALDRPAIAFVLARGHWGQGFATEAAGAVMRHAFGTLGLTEVGAEAVAHNTASLRVLAKLGFEVVERFTDEADGALCVRLARRR